MKYPKHLLFIAIVFLTVQLSLTGCGKRPSLIPLNNHNYPNFEDTENKQSLISATLTQIHYLKQLPLQDEISLAGNLYSNKWLLESAQTFLEILNNSQSSDELADLVSSSFIVYQAGGRDNKPAKEMLITGYYEPLLEGRLDKKPPFLYPLYSKPKDLVTKDNQNTNNIGRLDNTGSLKPYWTRAEIEENNILAGNELVYLKDPVDAFSLHVQGSGKVSFPDGSIRSIHYAGSNGREYSSIGKLMVDQGIMELAEVTMPRIREYIQLHPEQMKPILHHNEKYIFFSWAKTNDHPKGSTGANLTPGRSIAIDQATLPMGTIAYLTTRQPVVDKYGKVISWKSFQRFVMPQDSGSAIKGAGRADIFWGNDKYAKIAAGTMKEKGQLFFLIKKGYSRQPTK